MADNAPKCFRVTDVALRWNCSTGKVRKMISTGQLGCLQIGGMLRIPIVEVEACEARSKIKASPAPAASPDATVPTPISSGVAALRSFRIQQRLNRPARGR